jgi:hydroxymethylpyrimidine/phosphomethylpyrimidine kinase
MRAQARALRAMGAKAVLLKGGHLANSDVVPDWLVTADDERRYANPRIATRNTHGTGCTLSAALAAIQPACRDWQIATEKANAFLHDAICHADDLQVGRGCGPVNHLNGQLTMDN